MHVLLSLPIPNITVYSSKVPHFRKEIGLGIFLIFIWGVCSIVVPQKHGIGFFVLDHKKREWIDFHVYLIEIIARYLYASLLLVIFLDESRFFYDKPVSLFCPSWWTHCFCGRAFLKVLGFSRYIVFSISSVHLHRKQSIFFWNIPRMNLPNN